MMRSRIHELLALALIGAAFHAGPLVVRGSAQPESTLWMPESATFIAHLDLGTVVSNANFHGLERVLEAQFDRGTLDQFRELTGMDPWRDVFSISYFSQTAKEGEQLWGITISGAFDLERILTSLEARTDVDRSEHRDTLLYVPGRLGAGTSSDGEPNVFAFVNGSTILLGPAESVRLMLDVSNGFEPSSAEGPLARFLDRMSAGEVFWIVSVGKANLGKLLRIKAQDGVSIPVLDCLAVSARLGGGVAFRMEGEAKDSEDARKLADILRGAMAMATLSNDSSLVLSDIAQSLELETVDERVDVSFEIDSQTIREWLKERHKQLDDRTP